jgi:hypothetical protein
MAMKMKVLFFWLVTPCCLVSEKGTISLYRTEDALLQYLWHKM